MRHRLLSLILAALLGAAFSFPVHTEAKSATSAPHVGNAPYRSACPVAKPGQAQCFAEVVASPMTSAPYGPTTLHSAYTLPWTSPVPQTIGIVDAGGDTTIAADVAAFDARYQLPAANLTVVNQNGGSSLPPAQGWELEIALDVETAHGICTNCKLLLVEANSPSGNDLATAENTAVSMGATEISNSYGGGEIGWDTSAFNHPGVAITASTGDSGYGVSAPASFASVIAVGGTSLFTNSDGTYNSESAWSRAGSGCSAYVTRPAFQGPLATGCANRAEADVSADADPNTGVDVLDHGAWELVGGTSLSSPLVAGVIALAGGMAGVANPASIAYTHAGSFRDITSGANGSCGAPLCTAGPGYDGPTGLGSVDGLNGFRVAGSTPSPTPTPRPTSTSHPTATPIFPTATATSTPSPTMTPVHGFCRWWRSVSGGKGFCRWWVSRRKS